MDLSFRCLADEVAAAMRGWEEGGEDWGDEAFDDLARRAFHLQYEGIDPYRRYCERRGALPGDLVRWAEIPPVPVAAFRHVPLIVGGTGAAELEFLTSGTTAGQAERGRHLVRDPALYRASMEAAFRRLAIGTCSEAEMGRDRGLSLPVPELYGSLVPPFPDSPSSSLAWMIDGLMERFGDDGSRHFASASGIDRRAATDFAARAETDGRPVCILTTTLALDAWIRFLEDHDERRRLPPGSMVMDTGGAKGREALDRDEVCQRASRRLCIDRSRIVNEFGMTELLSQLYSGAGTPWFRGPPWLRVRALDPNDLSPVPDGEAGLLCYFDLANLGSVSAVLTEDVGRVSGGAMQWLRRFPGAPPRGCSLATAELLAAQEASAGG